MSSTPQVTEPRALQRVAPSDEPSALTHRRSADEMLARRARIIEVMTAVMKEKVHYGKIPGCPKPSLFKPGAEVLLSTFRLGSRPGKVVDLSGEDEVRYRVEFEVFEYSTEATIAVGIGECSSNETKYKWRAPVCPEEFDGASVDRRRMVWKRGDHGGYQLRQVRTEPADGANTILKMAKKRAMIDATLAALAASDVFTQDVESLPEGWSEIRDDEGESVLGAGSAAVAHFEPKAKAAEPAKKPEPAKKAAPKPEPKTWKCGNGHEHDTEAGAESCAPDDVPPGEVEAEIIDAEVGLCVTDVRLLKSGKNSTGAWNLYGVKFSDGIEALTFSESAVAMAKACAESGVAVDREIEHDEKRNRENLIILREKKQ